MKIDQAKSIPLAEFLANLGFHPIRSQSDQLWYLSPLRSENTPSFKVNSDLNVWFDFGLGKGGTIIDFALAYRKDTSVPAALRMIESTMKGWSQPLEAKPLAAKRDRTTSIQVNYIGSLKNHGLKRYVADRGISLRKCGREISEVHYRVNGREYLAIGFQSDEGGYETRSSSFKGSLGCKSISTRTSSVPDSATVFEGFFDYLTYLTLWGRPMSQVIVLNSVGMQEHAVEYLQRNQVRRIDLFRDNDSAGSGLLKFFKEQLPAVTLIDRAADYPDHKDLNEWHVSKLKLRLRA